MTETSSNVRSIQGEQMPDDTEAQVYLSFTGPGVPVALSKLAPLRSGQRFVLDARAVADSVAERADGEERRTIKFKIVEIAEYGEVTAPESDPSLFDQVDDDAAEG